MQAVRQHSNAFGLFLPKIQLVGKNKENRVSTQSMSSIKLFNPSICNGHKIICSFFCVRGKCVAPVVVFLLFLCVASQCLYIIVCTGKHRAGCIWSALSHISCRWEGLERSSCKHFKQLPKRLSYEDGGSSDFLHSPHIDLVDFQTLSPALS